MTLGFIIGVFGLASDPALYHPSLGMNVNFYRGTVESRFGSLVFAFGRSPQKIATTAIPVTLAPSPARGEAVSARRVIAPPVEPCVAHG